MTEPDGVTFCADRSYRLVEGERVATLPPGTTPAELTAACERFFTQLQTPAARASRAWRGVLGLFKRP